MNIMGKNQVPWKGLDMIRETHRNTRIKPVRGLKSLAFFKNLGHNRKCCAVKMSS